MGLYFHLSRVIQRNRPREKARYSDVFYPDGELKGQLQPPYWPVAFSLRFSELEDNVEVPTADGILDAFIPRWREYVNQVLPLPTEFQSFQRSWDRWCEVEREHYRAYNWPFPALLATSASGLSQEPEEPLLDTDPTAEETCPVEDQSSDPDLAHQLSRIADTLEDIRGVIRELLRLERLQYQAGLPEHLSQTRGQGLPSFESSLDIADGTNAETGRRVRRRITQYMDSDPGSHSR